MVKVDEIPISIRINPSIKLNTCSSYKIINLISRVNIFKYPLTFIFIVSILKIINQNY